MTTAEAFLEDIIANPADDTPRLIYADWLEENEQSERAELIRVQIRIQECLAADSTSGLHDLFDREAELLGLLFGHPPKWVEEWQVGRGFVFRVRCKCQAWMVHGPRLVRLHPIQRVDLTDVRIDWVDREPGFNGWRAYLPYDVPDWCPGYYPFSDAVVSALSQRCIDWARGQEME